MAFDLKEFLKPTWAKVLIALIAFSIFSSYITSAIDYWAIPPLGLSHNWRCDPNPCENQDVTAYFALAAMVSYLLACALIFAHARLFGRKKAHMK